MRHLKVSYLSRLRVYIYLTRGLELQYIGDPVQGYNHIKVLRSVELKDKNEIRFILESNDILVYNHHYKKWSVIEFDCQDSVVFRDEIFYIGGGTLNKGFLSKEINNENPASSIPSALSTGWVSFSLLSEFKKVKAIKVTLELDGAEEISCDIKYNFDESVSETLNLTESRFNMGGISGLRMGDQVFGGQTLSDVRRIRFQPKRQKCESFKIDFKFQAKRVKITALGFEYFTTGTLGRVPPSLQAGGGN